MRGRNESALVGRRASSKWRTVRFNGSPPEIWSHLLFEARKRKEITRERARARARERERPSRAIKLLGVQTGKTRERDIPWGNDRGTSERETATTELCVWANTCKRAIRRSSLLANRSRDRRVSSKQFMLLGEHRVRRALSGRTLIRRRMVSPRRMAREYKGKGRDVSACRSASLSCRR